MINRENIGGLDVAVDDAFGVGRVEAIGNFDGDVEELGNFDGPALDAVLKSLPFEKFHGDEGAAFEFANIVNGADVGVIEGGSGAGFAMEALDGLGIIGNVVGEEFEGDVAAEAGVLGFVDHAHPAAAEFFLDGVMRDGTADGRGSVRHGEVDSTRAGRGRQTGGGALVGAADQTISRKLPVWLKVTTNLEKKPFWPRRPSPTSLRCRKSPRKGRIRKRSEEAYQKCGPLRERYRNMRSGADSKYLRRHKHSDWESALQGALPIEAGKIHSSAPESTIASAFTVLFPSWRVSCKSGREMLVRFGKAAIGEAWSLTKGNRIL